jgi:hypothetical protein
VDRAAGEVKSTGWRGEDQRALRQPDQGQIYGRKIRHSRDQPQILLTLRGQQRDKLIVDGNDPSPALSLGRLERQTSLGFLDRSFDSQ